MSHILYLNIYNYFYIIHYSCEDCLNVFCYDCHEGDGHTFQVEHQDYPVSLSGNKFLDNRGTCVEKGMYLYAIIIILGKMCACVCFAEHMPMHTSICIVYIMHTVVLHIYSNTLS